MKFLLIISTGYGLFLQEATAQERKGFHILGTFRYAALVVIDFIRHYECGPCCAAY